jgi:hypothetical protein
MIASLRFLRRKQDPFTAIPVTSPACRACSPLDYGRCNCPEDCGWVSCTGGWRDVPPDVPHGIATPETLAALVARAEAEQGPWKGASNVGVTPARTGGDPLTQPIAKPSGPIPIAVDYRALPVFRSTTRDACAVGLTGIGTRGVHPVPPLPDYDLDRFAADVPTTDFGPEFDQIAKTAEAGFYEANRMFHRADTAGFPAVTS